MKILVYIMCFLMLMTTAHAAVRFEGVTLGAIGGSKVSGSIVDLYSLTYYHNCDSATTATYSAGSSTVTYEDSSQFIDSTTPIVGEGSWSLGNTYNGYAKIPALSNISDITDCRIGFFFRYSASAVIGDVCSVDNAKAEFSLTLFSTTFNILYYRGTDETFPYASMNAGSTHFVEFKFDGNNCSIYIDGEIEATQTDSGAISATDFWFGTWGNTDVGEIDQIFISSDKNANLYEIRNETIVL